MKTGLNFMDEVSLRIRIQILYKTEFKLVANIVPRTKTLDT